MTEDDAEQRLRRALDQALERYGMVMGEGYPADAVLTVSSHDAFIAVARPCSGGVEIIVSKGVVTAITDLWTKAMTVSDQLPEDQQLNVVNTEDAINASLVFLVLHELHHHQIGHLELVGAAGISETSMMVPELGLTSFEPSEPVPIETLDPDDAILVRRCLELQADHDALEILLDHYSNEGWGYIRFYMATAMAIMILIEIHGRRDNDDKRSYPSSATRIFQLFGALAFLWQPTPTSDWSAPDEDERQAFNAEVVIPAISDAIILAAAGNTSAIITTANEIDVLFEDMRILQNLTDEDVSALRTQGAIEFAQLAPFNQIAKELLGPEKFFI